MTRFHATSEGNIPFTEAEEAQWDIQESQWSADTPNRAMVDLREQRNQLLAETDHYALQDVNLSDEMITYRQALRDLPANTNDPMNPIFPDNPEV